MSEENNQGESLLLENLKVKAMESVSEKKLTPLYNNIIIEAYEKGESQTKSGLIVQDGHGATVEEVKVLAVGCGTVSLDGTLVPPRVKVGDRVLVVQGHGMMLKVGALDSRFKKIIKENEIIAIVED